MFLADFLSLGPGGTVINPPTNYQETFRCDDSFTSLPS